MELVILGTAAAEGWPAPFCLCPFCQEARRRGGMNIRARSGALIDDELKIDFGPDTVGQMQRTGRHLANVKTLVFTHQHSDHFVPTELEWAARPFTQTPPATPVELWGNSQIIDDIKRLAQHMPADRFNYKVREIAAGGIYRTSAGDEIWALPADHVVGASVLRIRRKGKVLFYGHDSGLYPQATMDALCDGIPLDIALLDCTNGGLKTENRGHMGCDGVKRTVAELRRRGAITEATRVIATHFSHNGGLLHEELVRTFLPDRIEVAFDGMVVRAD